MQANEEMRKMGNSSEAENEVLRIAGNNVFTRKTILSDWRT